MIKITPPSSASDTRLKVYHFVEAVKSLPTSFTRDELEFIYKKVNPRLCGQLRSLFICLSDDDFRKSRPKAQAQAPEQEDVGSETETASGTETESAEQLVSKPPPTVPAPKHDKGKNRNRGDKRGAASPPDSVAPPKK